MKEYVIAIAVYIHSHAILVLLILSGDTSMAKAQRGRGIIEREGFMEGKSSGGICCTVCCFKKIPRWMLK